MDFSKFKGKKVEKGSVEQEATKKALERISKNPAAPFNDAVKGVKGTDTRADSSD